MGNTNLRIFMGCFASTVLLLFRYGYTFGSEDQSEMLPYAKYLADNTLYASDFYIQSIASFVPNERYIFSWFLSLLGQNMNWGVFALHFVATMLLMLGLYRLAEKGFRTEGGRWIAALAPVMLLYDVNLGGNELYYNTFIPSYVAQVMGIWVFLYAINGRILAMYMLLTMMTYIHPLIGFQLWGLISLSFFTLELLNKEKSFLLTLLIFNILYLTIAGFFIFKIKNGYDSGSVSAEYFLNIIEFRAPHHYFPHYFPLKNWFILALPFYIGWRASDGIVKLTFRWIAVGTLVYIIGIYILKNPTPLSMQWFSTTVWVKTFSFLISLSYLELIIVRLLEAFYPYQKTLKSNFWIVKSLLVAGFLSLIFMTPQYRLFKQKPYDFPFFQTDNSKVEISKLAKERTSKEALFLIPSDLSEFRFWSERSSFIDYKATNHRQAAFVEWYKRIQDVYKISLEDRLKGANLTELANQNFGKWTEKDFLQFKSNQHVTYIIIYKKVVLDFPKIAENEQYVIYKIQ